MMSLRTLKRSEDGQSLVLVIISLVAIIAVIGLAVDGGYAYSQRRHMQNAADAAAMAGVWQLAMNGSGAVASAVAQYATNNGADTYSWSLTGGGRTVQVTTQVTFNTFLARIVGLNTMTAAATSSASIGRLSGSGNLLPLAIEDEEFVVGQLYDLWDNTLNVPGGFGWLDWNGVPVGNPELASNICTPSNSGVWRIGDWVPSGPGVQNSSSVIQCLNTWLGREVTIIIYDQTRGNGSNAEYRIKSFARFVLEGYRFNGNPKYVRGRFVRRVMPGEMDSGIGNDFELRTVDIVQ